MRIGAFRIEYVPLVDLIVIRAILLVCCYTHVFSSYCVFVVLFPITLDLQQVLFVCNAGFRV
jgi:NhaP-type Na+/H+ and K+/H+ antiporter